MFCSQVFSYVISPQLQYSNGRLRKKNIHNYASCQSSKKSSHTNIVNALSQLNLKYCSKRNFIQCHSLVQMLNWINTLCSPYFKVAHTHAAILVSHLSSSYCLHTSLRYLAARITTHYLSLAKNILDVSGSQADLTKLSVIFVHSHRISYLSWSPNQLHWSQCGWASSVQGEPVASPWHKQHNFQQIFNYSFAFGQTQFQGVLIKTGSRIWSRGGHFWHCTWMRCSSVSCSCILVMEVLLPTAGSGVGRGRSRGAEPAAGSGFGAAALAGAGLGWVNTMGDISSVGVTVAGTCWGEITWPDKNTGVTWSCLPDPVPVETVRTAGTDSNAGM